MGVVLFVKKTVIKLMRFFTLVRPNRVFFSSFSGLSYSDNPKYISESLHKLSPKTEIIWGFKEVEKKRNSMFGEHLKRSKNLQRMNGCVLLEHTP